jgi:hypothetical protein
MTATIIVPKRGRRCHPVFRSLITWIVALQALTFMAGGGRIRCGGNPEAIASEQLLSHRRIGRFV